MNSTDYFRGSKAYSIGFKITIESFGTRVSTILRLCLFECEKSYELYQGWLHEDPQWGWGWIGWADCYFFRPKEAEVNLKRAEEILRQGLAIDNVRDRCEILDRLIGVLDDTGDTKEANRLREELQKELDALDKLRWNGSVFGDFHAMSSENAMPSAFATVLPKLVNSQPATIGKKEPCPCGSGKKYKRCCGAAL